MRVSLPALRRAFQVYTLRKIFTEQDYVAVFQLTGGRSWGRSKLAYRICGHLPGVSARYAQPFAARKALQDTHFSALAGLFRGGPCALVYGSDVTGVIEGVKKARENIDGGVLVGGRFASEAVTGRVWDELVDGKGLDEMRRELVGALDDQRTLPDVLDESARRLCEAFESSNVGLIGILGQREASL